MALGTTTGTVLNTYIMAILIGVNFNAKMEMVVGDLTTPNNYFINEDMSFGTTPSTGNANLDLLYNDVRYRVLQDSILDYIKQAQAKIKTTNKKVTKYLTSQGHRSLCNSLIVPALIRKGFINPGPEMVIFKNIIIDKLQKAKASYAYLGADFVSNLESHISYLMILLDVVFDNPATTISTAYSVPNWGYTSLAASNACLLNFNSLKN